MWNNDDFSPETVDEQIERFVQVRSRQHRNAVLTQELEVMCEEDRAMLERVWARYAARLSIRSSLDAQPTTSPSPFSLPNAGAFSAIPTRHKARPEHHSRRVFALVATLLVAAVLVGSAQWAVRTLRQPGRVATHLTATPQLTQTHASTPTPTVVPPTLAPSGREDSQLVYDDATNALLLFSGRDFAGTGPLTDTWIWTGLAWTQLHPSHHPVPRTGAAIAYDPATQQVVLFGGASEVGNTSLLDDTWTWNGSDWTQQHPANSPSVRAAASLAYDTATGQLVLFGGDHTGGGWSHAGEVAPNLNDTWVWTGSNWVQQHPATAPSVRFGASLAYDAATQNLVLFGGSDQFDSTNPNASTMNDTWIWTGSNWVQQHPTTLPSLTALVQGVTMGFAYPSMVYNPTDGKLMLTLMGQGSSHGSTDSWTQADWIWTGSDWTEVNTTGPAVMFSQLFYDAHLHTVFEFTSFLPFTSVDVENKLWKWTGQTWVIVESW